ncbi:Regulator of Vps4 activity in the MVB pathway protein [Citrus sinensis]|uniref:IST1-like protein n=1 Tax=Citrus unshiu TaxID=55188 RepID=A0A2H5PDL6_CITUN|nr:uncharacterized protein LOC102617955 [Citrus sinensis]KAH9762801.1 Regulator of Vps4 activity in the MVB pathway protein [Citrus sinensis]GAY50444.1 hypothetical protein CUMW_126690 [Citrus unshiu]
MLHRSFKPAKCKTSLKLASSRIKLLKNKRGAQVKQLKRELAQLLESGQDQTARIRVEHVVREENTMAAYDLLEIYCELIVTRLPIVESQKNCPIDLKEAICSVIFASPRCADIPELMDVRKMFTSKYGKDFVSAAAELRPDCGVSRLLVEKLSVKAPDGPTKIKILTAIAEEHNIKWDPKSFGEKDSRPSEDLLNGPSTFSSASQMFVNPSNVQSPPNLDDKGHSIFHAPTKTNEIHGAPANVHEHNLRPPSSQTDSGANKTNFSAAFHPESMPTGSGTERMEFRHSYSGDGNASSMGGQNWNMEFKDAAAAARSAAESAERASLAARAAAELSSRGNNAWQYSADTRRDEELSRYANSTLHSEHHAKGPVNILHGRNSRMDYEQFNNHQQDDVAGVADNSHGDSLKSTNKSGQSASLKPTAASADGSAFVNNLQMADRYSRKNSSELGQKDNLSEISLKEQSSQSEVDYAGKLQGMDSKSFDDLEEAKFRNQSSHYASYSRSSTFSDDHDVSNYYNRSLGSDADENPFAVNNEGVIRTNSNKANFPVSASVVYDDYVSDEDEPKIDLQHQQKGHEYLEFSPHSGKSPTHMFSDTNAWREKQNIDESPRLPISRSHFSMEHQSDPVFTESWKSSTVPSQPDEMLPATFDDYDVPISKSEEELDKAKQDKSKDTNEGNIYSRTSEMTQGENHGFFSSFVDEENGSPSKPWLQSSSFDDPYSQSHRVGEGKHEQSQQPSRFSMGHEVRDNVLAKSVEDTETSKDSSPESGKELNFAMLTGGLRNKGYKHPPYVVNPSHNALLSKETTDHTSTKTEESLSATVNVSVDSGATSQDTYNRDMRAEADTRPSAGAYVGSHGDDARDEHARQISTSSQEHYTKRGGIEENKRSSSRTQFKYFDSSNSDSEDDLPIEASTNKARFNSGLSRRTKASPSNSKGSFNSKATILSKPSVSPGYVEERNSPSRSLFSNQTSQRPLSRSKISDRLGSAAQPRLEEQAANKRIQESKRSSFNDRLKPSEKEQTSKSLRKIVTSGNTENLNSASSSEQTPSNKKVSHVHPKLPDFDALTAHLQSLRTDR